MPGAAPHFEYFLRAVHRRLVVVRVLEHAGAGALAGCAGAAVFLPLLLWRDESTLLPVLILIALGAVAGTWWGVVRRPSRLSAAMEADRQLQLRDLLGTAAGAGPRDGSDPWLLTVLALADDQCRRHTPSQVVLRRYGSRAWGGIGLAASLVLTLAALLSAPGTTPVVASRDPDVIADGAPRNGVGTEVPAPAPPAAAPNVAVIPPHESRSIDASTGNDAMRPDDARASSGESPNSSEGRSAAATGQEGKGGGAGRAGSPRVASPGAPSPSSPGPRSASSAEARANATPAGGGADARERPSTDGDVPGAAGSETSASNDLAGRAAPWESSAWPADARAAEEAVEARRVPDSYRDLVREFFDR